MLFEWAGNSSKNTACKQAVAHEDTCFLYFQQELATTVISYTIPSSTVRRKKPPVSILVINAGSSSVKFGLFRFDDLEPIAQGLLDWAGQKHRATIALTPRHGDPIQRELEAVKVTNENLGASLKTESNAPSP